MNGDDPRGALVYSAAVRSLDQQASVVDNVRSRAGVLLSAASIATGFLAGIALGETRSLSGWGWSASVAFIAIGGLCVWLLWPRHEWKFSPNARVLVRDYLDPEGVTIARAQRNLSLHMARAWDTNRQKLRWMFRCFEAACVLLGVEVLLWIADLTWGR